MAINYLNSINLNQNELIKARVENQPNNAAAGTGVEGQIFYDTTVDKIKVWANGAWTAIGSGVESVTSGNSNTITIGGTSTNPTVAANTASVSSGSLNLVTGDAVYSFVTGLGYVESVSAANSTFVSTAISGTAIDPIITASLSATGTPDNTKYLRGDNTWSPISGIYDWNLAGDFGTTQNIISGETVIFTGGAVIYTTVGAANTLTINHASISRTDTTSTASPSAGATFTAVDSVTSSAEGHITALNLKTVTLPSNPTITLTGDVTGSGTTSIATTIAAGAVEFAMIDSAVIVTSSEGIENNNNNTTIPTSAAVKAYADSLIVGGLIYQGGYNAATNTPDLTTSPNSIKKGWTYTVTADGTFFTEQVRVGDVLIAEVDDPSALANWTTVQNNVDLASLTQVGIGNVNAGSGVDVTYSNGTATVENTDKGSSQNIFKNIAASGQTTIVADSNNDTLTFAAGVGIAIGLDPTTDTITITGQDIPALMSYATTISDTATVTHSLGTKDVMVQLYDTVTFDTVYADVTRPTINTVTITFASTPTNPIRVLVQK